MDRRGVADHPSEFGHFRVIAPLARGGMGLVYLAEDDTGREVVVKTIRADLAADAAYRARFRSEAQAALRFRSNLVARVWDCDANADPPWIALEKIDGPTLRELIIGGRVMDHVALSAFAADLAEGIHAFFDQGMAHGDLTPANVIIQDANRLKILDLGLARPTADETATGDLPVMGTPYWLAPEVAAGFATDSLSDVNQWGKLVLFAGTGYPEVGPASLRDALQELPPPLRPIVERSMSAVPDARPAPDELWMQTRERRLSGGVPPLLGLSAHVLATQPGGEDHLIAMVHNRGATTDRYRFEVLGPLAPWAFIDPAHETLIPGGSVDIQVGVRLPTGSPVAPGNWPFAIRCVSENDEARSAVAEGTVAVRAVDDIAIELVAKSSRARWTGRYVFRVINRGNAPVKARLGASGADGTLSFAVSPPIMELDPGEVKFGLVKVRARRPRLAGRAVRRRFRIGVSVEDQITGRTEAGLASLEAELVQVPILSRWGATILLALVLVAGAVIGAAYLGG